MLKSQKLLPLILILITSSLTALEQGEIKVLQLQGEAYITELGKDGKTQKLNRNDIFKDNHGVGTGLDSSCALLFSNGSIIKLKANTFLNVKTFKQEKLPQDNNYEKLAKDPNESKTDLFIGGGDMSFDVKKSDPKSEYNIGTPLGTAGIRGTGGDVSFRDALMQATYDAFPDKDANGNAIPWGSSTPVAESHCSDRLNFLNNQLISQNPDTYSFFKNIYQAFANKSETEQVDTLDQIVNDIKGGEKSEFTQLINDIKSQPDFYENLLKVLGEMNNNVGTDLTKLTQDITVKVTEGEVEFTPSADLPDVPPTTLSPGDSLTLNTEVTLDPSGSPTTTVTTYAAPEPEPGPDAEPTTPAPPPPPPAVEEDEAGADVVAVNPMYPYVYDPYNPYIYDTGDEYATPADNINAGAATCATGGYDPRYTACCDCVNTPGFAAFDCSGTCTCIDPPPASTACLTCLNAAPVGIKPASDCVSVCP